jgi:RNA polymerase sigma-70 factor (ECF subfamily)
MTGERKTAEPAWAEADQDNKRWAVLIEKVAAGDDSALASLYDSTSRMIFGLLLRILNNAATAEEVLIDVYVQVWRQASSYDRRRGSPMAWLIMIARSRAIDRLRSGRQEREREEPLKAALADRSMAPNPEEIAAASELSRLVRSALSVLSPEQREAIELAYYSGLSHSQIAERLRQPLGTVKTRIRLGMMKLRELLKPVLRGAAE